MIDKITEFLTNKIRKEMPDVDDERAEVINYGLQILLGEVPKFFINRKYKPMETFELNTKTEADIK